MKMKPFLAKLYNLTLELCHFAMSVQPCTEIDNKSFKCLSFSRAAGPQIWTLGIS